MEHHHVEEKHKEHLHGADDHNHEDHHKHHHHDEHHDHSGHGDFKKLFFIQFTTWFNYYVDITYDGNKHSFSISVYI